MDKAFWFLISVLATFRISMDLAREKGPFNLFAKLRTALQRPTFPAWVKEGSICPICWSFWIGFAISILPAVWFNMDPGQYFLYGLGVAGAVRAYAAFIWG